MYAPPPVYPATYAPAFPHILPPAENKETALHSIAGPFFDMLVQSLYP